MRREAAERYRNLLERVDEIELPPHTLPEIDISWFVYVVRLRAGVNRHAVRDRMASDGVVTAAYFEPIHQQAAWSRLARGEMPVAESAGSRTLALPFFTRIAPQQQEAVASSLMRAIMLQKQ